MTRVLHMFDCAGVARALLTAAHARGLPWRYLPRMREAYPRPFRGDFALWAARRTVAMARAEVLHVHFGDRARWAQKWPHRPYVLHLHGTDIRELHGMPEYHRVIQDGVDRAAAVLYSTPDLGEAARAARADAAYLPNPVDTGALPSWRPADRPRVVFASRWDPAKGLADQLRIAHDLVHRLGGEVEVVGLEWGAGAEQARAAGVALVSPMPREHYLQWLAGAHVVVGQAAGVLAISELQAMGIGVPVVMPPPHPSYDDPAVLARPPAEVAETVAGVLSDPAAASARLDAPGWVRRHHDPGMAIDQLQRIYAAVLGH